jgi:hypothetical protein
VVPVSRIHREHPEASEEEIDAMQRAELLGIGPRARPRRPRPTDEATLTRACRDCGQPFDVPLSKANAPGKWYALCAYCLAGEL